MTKFKNRVSFSILIFEVLYLISVYFLKSSEVAPDFRVFYLQSQRFISGGDVFNYNDYVAYNSTFLYLLLSPLTLFGVNVASKIFLVINILLVPVVSLLLARLFFENNLFEKFVQILAILCFSFFTRSILNNGQVGIIMILLLLTAVYLMDNYGQKKFLIASLLWFAFELKPYLLVPFLIWLVVIGKQYKIGSIFLGTGIFFEVIYWIINPTSNVVAYIDLLTSRANNVNSELDQSSISAVLSGVLGISSIYSYSAHILVFVIFFIRSLNELKKFDLVSLAIVLNLTLILNVYVHRQDPILTILFLVLIFTHNKIKTWNNRDKFQIITILILLGNWGNSNVIFAIILDIFLVFILYQISLKKSSILRIFFICLGMQIFQIFILDSYGWLVSYEFWRILILIYLMLCSFAFLTVDLRKKVFSEIDTRYSQKHKTNFSIFE